MKIVNEISKSIKSIPKDKVVSSYFVGGVVQSCQSSVVNGVVYNDMASTVDDYFKGFEVFYINNVDENVFLQSISYYAYTRDGIDGYFKNDRSFKFNKYMTDTGALPYESIYYYLSIILNRFGWRKIKTTIQNKLY